MTGLGFGAWADVTGLGFGTWADVTGLGFGTWADVTPAMIRRRGARAPVEAAQAVRTRPPVHRTPMHPPPVCVCVRACVFAGM